MTVRIEMIEDFETNVIEVYKNISHFYTDYQKGNGKSHWIIFITDEGEQFAVEYEPKKESIECFND